MKANLLSVLGLVLLLTSCDRFLDIVPVGKLIPRTVEDYELMFNDDQATKLLNPETFFGAPDFYMSDEFFRSSPDYDRACYIWAKQVFDENSVSYSDWSSLYSEIYRDNVILAEVGEAEGEDLHRRQVIAEARTRRALSYLFLVGIYAKQYDAVTAATDLGVPLRTDAGVDQKAPDRASVKEVYSFIETELLESYDDLPEEAPNKFRVCKPVCHAVLARLYLMMMRYEDARIYADKALAGKKDLYDYNKVVVNNGYVRRVMANANEENYLILYFQFVNWGGYDIPVSRELYHLFPHDGTDLREEYQITVEDEEAGEIYWGNMMVISVAPTVPEMYLIRAEGYARKGDQESVQKAMEDVNHLRSNRVVTGTESLKAATSDEAMKVILAERRKEFGILGPLNWFDMKRLNKESKYARTLTRIVEGKTYTLAPGGNNYVMPIPYDVLGYNKDVKDNPRD